MHLLQAFVDNPVKVSVGVLLVVLFGTIAATSMPMQLTPEVQIPTLTIETRWRGASPQEVERELIQEQEKQLKGVEGVTKMTSESMNSMGRITLEFAVGTNLGEALLKVNTRLQQVSEYPIDADEPIISTANSSDRPIAWFMLTPRVRMGDEIAEYQREHPEFAELLEPVRRAQSSGLALRRLRQLTDSHPQLAELLPREDLDVSKLRKFAEDMIEAEFERVKGVSNSEVIGGEEEEMQVIVDPQRLAARQLTIQDVRQALRAQNQDTSAGDFWEGKRSWVVRTMGQYRSPEQIANTIIARRDGAPVYVRDVGEVRHGFKKPDGLVRQFGTPGIAVNCIRETGANVLEVMHGLREATDNLNNNLLHREGLMLTQVYDETDYIYSSVDLVKDNIVIGGLLTAAVLLLFLRSGRSTLIIALAIPTSIIGTFLVMNLLGRSLNVISLAGLAFAVGMLVDNAVVVLENIYRRFQGGEPPVRAAVHGAQEVWGAVVASTLTTLAVFLPVLFVEEEAGQLFRDIALAISSAVGLSLIVSITLIPTAAAKLLRSEQDDVNRRSQRYIRSRQASRGQHADGADAGDKRKARRRGIVLSPRQWLHALGAVRPYFHAVFLRPIDRFALGFVGAVVRINAWLQRNTALRIATVLLFVGVSISLSYALMPKVEYLPSGNRNLVFGILLPPPGYNLDQLLALGEQVEESMRPYWDIDPDDPAARDLKYPVIGDYFFVVRGRQVFFGLRAADPLRAGELVPLVLEAAGELPATFAVSKQSSLFEQGLSAGRTIDIEIAGPSLETLVELGGRIMGQVATVVPNAQAFPKPSLDLSSPEVHIVPKWEQAADMNITAVDLGYTVDALVDGAYATDYFSGGDKIDLTIMGEEDFARRTQSLESLPVATPTGELVPLAAVARVELRSGPEQINHRERQRAITIEVSPPVDMALEDAMERIQSQIVEPLQASGALDGGYRISLAGTADKLRATWLALRFNVLLALLITYLLMAALFESWLYPLVIILSVPLGAVGGFAGLSVLNQFVLQPLDVLTMLGFVVLIGTVVNNPILIVHQSLNNMREANMPQREAILDSVRGRIRPIFMTTMTTSLGLLPLVLFPGAGSELYRGLGSVMLGGLLVSTVFTLVLVPTLFSLAMDARDALSRLLRRDDDQSPPPADRARQERPAAMSVSS